MGTSISLKMTKVDKEVKKPKREDVNRQKRKTKATAHGIPIPSPMTVLTMPAPA